MEDQHSRPAEAAASCHNGFRNVPGHGLDPAEPVNAPSPGWTFADLTCGFASGAGWRARAEGAGCGEGGQEQGDQQPKGGEEASRLGEGTDGRRPGEVREVADRGDNADPGGRVGPAF